MRGKSIGVLPGTCLAALAAIPFPPLGTLAQSAPDASVHASAEDCAVIAEIGKNQLKWREGARDLPMTAASFGADCDWKAFGTAGPAIVPVDPGPYYEGLRLSFSRPIYSADGRQATVEYGVGGNAGPKTYFYASYKCSAEKRDGRWQFVACKLGIIT